MYLHFSMENYSLRLVSLARPSLEGRGSGDTANSLYIVDLCSLANKFTIAVSPDPLRSSEGLASETSLRCLSSAMYRANFSHHLWGVELRRMQFEESVSRHGTVP